MRRERRINTKNDDVSMKIIKYASIGVGILAIIVFGLLLYSKSLNDEVKQGSLTTEQIASIMNANNSTAETESASTEIGKSVNEATNELNKTNEEVKQNISTNIINTNQLSSGLNTSKNTTSNTISNTTNKSTGNNVSTTQNNVSNNSTNSTQVNADSKNENEKVELSFLKPVEGDIVREFAKDNLIYSETLQEWTTHLGVDIKADKTTVVKSAEAGTVKTIKNDPRYGLTIVVEHENGYQTVYANLLTSEFVVEGEKVEKGQSLGTVGNTAVFEIVDEAHLHFEILKDSVPLDPSIYLK